MQAKLIANDGNELVIQVKVKMMNNLVESECMILDACDQVGQLATLHALKKFGHYAAFLNNAQLSQ